MNGAETLGKSLRHKRIAQEKRAEEERAVKCPGLPGESSDRRPEL